MTGGKDFKCCSVLGSICGIIAVQMLCLGKGRRRTEPRAAKVQRRGNFSSGKLNSGCSSPQGLSSPCPRSGSGAELFPSRALWLCPLSTGGHDLALLQPQSIPHPHPTSSSHLFSPHCFCPLRLLRSPLAHEHRRHFSCWGVKCDWKTQFNKNNRKKILSRAPPWSRSCWRGTELGCSQRWLLTTPLARWESGHLCF